MPPESWSAMAGSSWPGREGRDAPVPEATNPVREERIEDEPILELLSVDNGSHLLYVDDGRMIGVAGQTEDDGVAGGHERGVVGQPFGQ